MIKVLLFLSFFLAGCSQKYLEINNHKIYVEIADTDSKRTQGLSGRNSLCPDCGLLFTFDKSGKYGFWMKDMKFSLDFIYINSSEVVDLIENVSPETYPDMIFPKNSFDKIIEVNAGYINKNQIAIGQKISLDLSNK